MNREIGNIPWPEGIKKTRQRVLVLEALAACELPVTAQELLSRLEQRGESVWLSTLYRVLDTFTERGVVLKTPVPDSGMAVYELRDEEHRHYAVCVQCHRVIRLDGCPLESYCPKLSEEDFHVLGHRLQMYGYCGRCIHKKEQ